MHAGGFKVGHQIQKSRKLKPGEFFIPMVGCGEMGKQAGQVESGQKRQSLDLIDGGTPIIQSQCIARHTQAAHPTVHLDMTSDRPVQGCHCSGHLSGVFQVAERRHEALFREQPCLLHRGVAHYENGGLDAGLAKFHPFFQTRHPQLVGTVFQGGTGHRHSPMAIAVGFYGNH